MTIEELKAYLIEKTKGQALLSEQDDFNPNDASGGNFDDAYQLGCDDGELIAWRDILEMIK